MVNTAIVCTTIFELDFLASLVANLEHFGHRENTEVIIIPDKKSPSSALGIVKLFQKRGFRIAYPSVEEQEQYLCRFPSISSNQLIPYNTDNRRNVGFLMALESRAEVLISIDDDNYADIAHDFVSCHAVCGKTVENVECVRSTNQWYNVCDLLETEPKWEIFPRGFPYRVRRAAKPTYTSQTETVRIGMNVGLWTGDPDVDAISRNFTPWHVSRWNGRQVCLEPGTWSPINTQNTALVRALIPAYYYVLMGQSMGGLVIDRFGDILSGYFAKKVCDHLGYSVLIGAPICVHRRTPHNLFKDLYYELAGIILLEEFTQWLESETLEGSNAIESYRSLANKIKLNAHRFGCNILGTEAPVYLTKIAQSMQWWSEAVESIM
jgi:hypothetical protein